MMKCSHMGLVRALLVALLAMPVSSYAQAPPATKAGAPADQSVPRAISPGPPQADPTANESAEAPAGPERAIERTRLRIQELEARTDVAPAIRDQALALLRSALGHYEAASASVAAATRFQEASQRSPERVAEAKQQLEALQKEETNEEFAKRVDKLPLTEAQQALDAANGTAATVKTDLDQLETRLREMSTRATAAREEQSAEKQALDALENPDDAHGRRTKSGAR